MEIRDSWRPYVYGSTVLKPCCRCGDTDEGGGRRGWHWRPVEGPALHRDGRHGGRATESICGTCLAAEEPRG